LGNKENKEEETQKTTTFAHQSTRVPKGHCAENGLLINKEYNTKTYSSLSIGDEENLKNENLKLETFFFDFGIVESERFKFQAILTWLRTRILEKGIKETSEMSYLGFLANYKSKLGQYSSLADLTDKRLHGGWLDMYQRYLDFGESVLNRPEHSQKSSVTTNVKSPGYMGVHSNSSRFANIGRKL
jgi:hypothetical protein